MLSQFDIIQNIQTSPNHQTIFLAGTFFASSYSKAALIDMTKQVKPLFHKWQKL